jgi:predicted membrane chloride channel (bestrophin family)
MVYLHKINFTVEFETDNDLTLDVIVRVVERHIKEALDSFTSVDYESINVKTRLNA